MKEIPLTRGKITLVDDEDYEFLNQFKWTLKDCHNDGKSFYAYRRPTISPGVQGHIGMHTAILNPPKNMQIDHIDGNGLNNQRSNIRIVTQRENQQNRHLIKRSSQYVGVSWDKTRCLWRSMITINKKPRTIGRFKIEIEAHIAYTVAEEVLVNGR